MTTGRGFLSLAVAGLLGGLRSMSSVMPGGVAMRRSVNVGSSYRSEGRPRRPTEEDRARLSAAEAKRARRAAKRVEDRARQKGGGHA